MNPLTLETKETASKRRNLPVVLFCEGIEEWRGTFGAFCEANGDGMSIEEIKAAGDAMMAGREYAHGGGAAPEFVLASITSP